MPKQTANRTKQKQCGICQEASKKYTCPRDQVAYCSIACFSIHKQQANCPGTRLSSPRVKIEPSESHLKSESCPAFTLPKIQAEEETIDEPVPVRRLEDLHWPPPLDDYQLAVFYDPLRRDEVKPLRKFEWEAIASSPALRTFLASAPSNLKEMLQNVSKQPEPEQRHRMIEQLLGLQPTNPPLHHRDHRQVGPQPPLVSDQEQKLFRPFAELVKDVLDTARGSNSFI
ncbi:hypothetical protein CROQUDRAFT_666420 [Cronartium quercuum f. sp. fusiforme G11]|uniref:HIT-type domain-containing protein n=1 Tax=Cronartium quercuum f. sp. fusiforme G11 TaxID=708437 RepID=A0A9P6T5B3_9BASI|nr:hypothetical protein CROQUDRAFT_666420 [Cronartium quercuum f. sp. fusiforme G11]